MTPEAARAVLAADKSGDRSGFSLTTATDGVGPARRGWFLRHATRAEYLAPTWPAAVARAREYVGGVERDAEITSAIASGSRVTDVAAEHGITTARAGQIARAAGVETRPGRRVTGAATHHTARGRALLARLVADAAGAGVEPEVYLDRLSVGKVKSNIGHLPIYQK